MSIHSILSINKKKQASSSFHILFEGLANRMYI
uniref:Uncharacterized protein n=1 Tax=Rhizophora mucronata TaxID=61149 RepID=A0A2P2Q247_RHIMU